jgi:hypothetical protein
MRKASSSNYKKVSLDEFSDDDSLSDGETNNTSRDPSHRQLQTMKEQDAGLELLAQATD